MQKYLINLNDWKSLNYEKEWKNSINFLLKGHRANFNFMSIKRLDLHICQESNR